MHWPAAKHARTRHISDTNPSPPPPTHPPRSRRARRTRIVQRRRAAVDRHRLRKCHHTLGSSRGLQHDNHERGILATQIHPPARAHTAQRRARRTREVQRRRAAVDLHRFRKCCHTLGSYAVACSTTSTNAAYSDHDHDTAARKVWKTTKVWKGHRWTRPEENSAIHTTITQRAVPPRSSGGRKCPSNKPPCSATKYLRSNQPPSTPHCAAKTLPQQRAVPPLSSGKRMCPSNKPPCSATRYLRSNQPPSTPHCAANTLPQQTTTSLQTYDATTTTSLQTYDAPSTNGHLTANLRCS